MLPVEDGRCFMKVGIVTDSTSTLTVDEAKELNVPMISLYIKKNDEFIKAIELDLEEYGKFLDECETIPTTSQPNPADFQNIFEALKEKYKSVIIPVISESLSGTFQSSKIAEELVDGKFKTIDSKLTAPGLGFLIENLVELSENGAPEVELVFYAKNFYKKVMTIFSVDDLKYLYKGGRLSKGSTVIGNFLNLKPIISLQNGSLNPIKKVRGNKKLISEMVQMASEIDYKRMMVVHSGRKRDAEELASKLIDKLGVIDIPIKHLEAIVMTHLGNKALGLIIEGKKNIYM